MKESMKEKYVFLLGGKDLEMEEIKNILDRHDCHYIDKNLNWGAKLSDYREEINKIESTYTIVGIELFKDIEIDKSYLEIDHHNKNVNKKSSIEQIAELLDIKLSRYQKLVAINDTGYIDALKKFGASEEEIKKIRRADRRAHGVTEEDERLAEESIKRNKIIINDLVVVKSKTNKFSTITDRLYPTEKLLIYTDDEFTYYGCFARELGQKYQEKYGQEKVYYGGGEDGYFGVAKSKLDLNDIEKMVIEVMEFVGE